MTVTLNPSDKQANVTLSGGDLAMALSSAALGWQLARATLGKSSGKHVFEVTASGVASPGSWGVGLATGSLSLSGTSYLGNNTSGVGIDGNGGLFFNAVDRSGGTFAIANGSAAMFVVDLDNKRLSVVVAGRTTASADLSTMSQPWFPAGSLTATGLTLTFNFGASAFTNQIPAGFTSWDGNRQGTDANTYRYFELTVTANGGVSTNETDLAELQLWTSPGRAGTNKGLTSGGTTWTSDSALNGTNVAAKLGDGTATAWFSANTALPHWARADLGTATRISSVGLTKTNTGTNNDPKTFKIRGSNDATTWTDLFTIANSGTPSGTYGYNLDQQTTQSTTEVTGTLTGTEGADSSSASGLATVTGTLAATDGADTASLSGTIRTTGTLAATDGADAAAFFGAAAITATGTLAATEGADSAALSGANVASGTLAAGEGADTASTTGVVRSTGTIAATDGADLAAVVGQTATSGVLAAVEGADAAAIVGGHTLPDWITIERSGTFTPTRGLIGTFIPARTLVGRFAPVKALAGTVTTDHELDGTFTPTRTLIGRTH